MKEYTFRVPVTGFEWITVEAESMGDAVDKVNYGDGEQLNLNVDWDDEPSESHIIDVNDV